MAILIGQSLPPSLGHAVAAVIAWIVSLFPEGKTYQALKWNQWIVSGKKDGEKQLKRTIRRILLNQGRALYDFYHSLDRPEEVRRLVSMTPRFRELVEECKREEKATLMLVPHISGFNLGGLRLGLEGLRYLTLSYPNPSQGYIWQNELRNRRGMEIVPMTVSSIGLARERLQRGGTVLTGLDRPLESSRYHPIFFGYKASLPVAYIRLAMKTRARVFVVGFLTLPDHSHLIDVSEQILMEEDKDPIREMEKNAEKVLKKAEEFIRKDPEQWMMFYPVWPQEIPTKEWGVGA